MKRILTMAAAAMLLVSCNNNKTNQNNTEMKQTVGQFQAYELDGFRLHVYNSNDVMADASFIIEGQDGLVVMEYPLFKVNAKEFADYIAELGKKVVTDITDYHLGGSDKLPIVMPEGMPAFIEGPVYGGMMKGFAQQFGETMVALPTQKASEVPFGSTQNYAGVDFRFEHGATSDFPGASIIIGNQVFYSHWAYYTAHMSPLQLGSATAIDAELEATKFALASGCKYYIGGHGGLVEKPAVEARVAYLEKVKQLRNEKTDAAQFAEALKVAYPQMPGDVDALAQALYK